MAAWFLFNEVLFMNDSTRVSGVRIANVARMSGKAKAPPHRPYDIIKVSYLTPTRDFEKSGDGAEFKRRAFGFEIKEADAIIDDGLFATLSELVFLEPCDIFVAPHPEDFTKMVIVDVEQKKMLVTSVSPVIGSSSPIKDKP
jgi:hypothetical protein